MQEERKMTEQIIDDKEEFRKTFKMKYGTRKKEDREMKKKGI